MLKHSFIESDGSSKTQKITVSLEIDSVYSISDSSGIFFRISIKNNSAIPQKITNPIYNTKLRIKPSIRSLKTKRQIRLQEVDRWPSPELAKKYKPYRLEEVSSTAKEIPTADYSHYWELDTLELGGSEAITYQLNLFEELDYDMEKRPYTKPLSGGKYHIKFNISLQTEDRWLLTKPYRGRLRLER